jgi:Zn-dependent protease with chaperone function
MRFAEKGVPAPVAIQTIADGITEQLRIKPIEVEVRRIDNIAAATCPAASECKIIIDERIAHQFSERAPEISGIIAHEIGHIVEPQTPKYLHYLPVFLALTLILLIYIDLAGWRYTLFVSLTSSTLIFFEGINAEGVFPSVDILIAFLMLVGAFTWNRQQKPFLKMRFVTVVIVISASQIVKYEFRRDEINADRFSMHIVGKDSAAQMFCFLKQEVEKRNLSSIETIYLELLDPHPSVDDRFKLTNTSSSQCSNKQN